jgi:AraC-like DNA-binding protein
MLYREVPVPRGLAHVALCGWLFTLDESDPAVVEHSIPPDGTTNLVLTRAPDASLHPILVGPSITAARTMVAQGFTHAGLRLRPEAAAIVMNKVPAFGSSEPLPIEGPLAGLWADLAELMHGSTHWQRAAASLGSGWRFDHQVAAAVDLLISSGGTITVGHLASRLGLSDRQLRRRFRWATGISPKQFAAVQRVRRALILSLEEPNWAEVAHETGFADQPHLARDIKGRFGAAPARVGGYIGRIRHEFVVPAYDRFVQDGGGVSG